MHEQIPVPEISKFMSPEEIEASYKRGTKYAEGFRRGLEKGKGYTGKDKPAKLGNEEDRVNFEAGYKAGLQKGEEVAKNE